MTRAHVVLSLVGLLAGCHSVGLIRAHESMINQGAIGWPRYQRTTPAALAPAEGADPRNVLLVFPEIDEHHVLHWNATQSFRIVLPRTPASVESRIPSGKAVGDLRTSDYALSQKDFDTLRCAFGRTWDGPKYNPKQFMVRPFCDDRRPAAARSATVPLVDAALDEVRALAARTGANVAADVRCYGTPDPSRFWCEATAEIAQ